MSPICAEPSFAQLRLVTLERLYDTQAAYNVTTGLRLRGHVDTACLRAALARVAARHVALRTAFDLAADPVQQVVGEYPKIDFAYEDLGCGAWADREARARRLATRVLTSPFDLARAPLWRVLLVALHDEEAWLVVTFHHVITDGWSQEVFWRELESEYASLLAGRHSSLPDPSMQYTEFARLERERFRSDLRERHLRYWRWRLEGAPPSVVLPLDRPRPALPSFRGARAPFVIGRDLSTAVRALAERHRATPFMVFLAVFAALLHRYSGQDEVVVGAPVANRARREVATLMGFLANTVVLRCDVSGDPTAGELLRRVRAVTLEALTHQELPFELLVQELAPRRDPGRQPLFDVMLSFEPAGRLPRLPGLRVEPLELPPNPSAKFDLSLTLGERRPGVLDGMLEYRTDLFDRATVEAMTAHFHRLLAEVVAVPEQRISRLRMLTSSERRTLVEGWGRGAAARAPECVHRLIERQADRSPGAPALRSGSNELDYASMDRAANRLARALRARDIGPERRVAVCLPRGSDLVVVLLAVLKAGGAYVPLEPGQSLERLRWLVADSGSELVITTPELRDQDVAGERRALCLAEVADELAGHSGAPLVNLAGPDNLAYVTYTSGSTGRPKGVMVPHRAVSNLLDPRQPFMPAASDVVVMHSAVAFDASTEEMWGALAAGACLLVAPAGVLDVRRYRELAREASVLLLTPSLLAVLAEEGASELAGIRLLDVGGEALSPEPVGSIRAAPGTVTLNTYGPTECTTISTAGSALVRTPHGRVPIGRPIVGATVHVLDRALQPVPVGVTGEIHVGGRGLSRGYVGQPAQTAGSFIPDAFSPEPGARLFRTGDLARWLPDGSLEFLGRRDDQVKLRGFRIELGEVEAALRAHAAVGGAAAAVREDRPGQRRLVGYVVSADERTLGEDGQLRPDVEADLRDHLRLRLPQHMVPSALVVIRSIPLTSGGKVDRRALPAPAAVPATGSTAREPRTPAQRLVARAWREVLDVAAVDVHDNFFDLGGDSIAMLRVAAALERGGVHVPVQVLYRFQTIRDLAAALDAEEAVSDAGRTP